MAVVALLVVLEGLLSIDNALVLGLLAKRLPKHEQAKALWYGLVGAFVFRVIAVLLASLLLAVDVCQVPRRGLPRLYRGPAPVLRIEGNEDEKIVLDEHGHPQIVDEETGGPLTEQQEELEIKRTRAGLYERRDGASSLAWPVSGRRCSSSN